MKLGNAARIQLNHRPFSAQPRAVMDETAGVDARPSAVVVRLSVLNPEP